MAGAVFSLFCFVSLTWRADRLQNASEMRKGIRGGGRLDRRVGAPDGFRADHGRVGAGTGGLGRQLVPPFNPLRKTELLSVGKE